jgi:DNA-binding transcriptional ArsR family regulator
MKPKVKTWLNQIESGMISSNTTRILHYIMMHDGCTILHMREDLLCSHQTLTAIISALMDEGLVKSIGEIEVDGSHYSRMKYVSDSVDRIMQMNKRREEKFHRFILSMGEYLDKLDVIQQHLDTLKLEDINHTHTHHESTELESKSQTSLQGTLF